MGRPSARELARKGLPVHARRVPAEVVAAIEAEGKRTRRTQDAVITAILTFWYEDLLAADEAKKKAALRAAGIDGVRVG